jgi:hypothetical protein
LERLRDAPIFVTDLEALLRAHDRMEALRRGVLKTGQWDEAIEMENVHAVNALYSRRFELKRPTRSAPDEAI